MSDYIARVELQAASADDYERLHVKMQSQGYSRTIKGSDGSTYELPIGTYVLRDTNFSIDIALATAVNAARDTGLRSSVIVADWTHVRWKGSACNVGEARGKKEITNRVSVLLATLLAIVIMPFALRLERRLPMSEHAADFWNSARYEICLFGLLFIIAFIACNLVGTLLKSTRNLKKRENR